MDDKTFFKWFRRVLLVLFIGIVVLFLTGAIKINIDRMLIGKFGPFEAAGRYHGYLIESDDIVGHVDMGDGDLLIYTRFVSGMPEGSNVYCVDFVEKTGFGYYFYTGAQMVFDEDGENSPFILYSYFPMSKDGLIVSKEEVSLIIEGKDLNMSFVERMDKSIYYQRLSVTEMMDFKFDE